MAPEKRNTSMFCFFFLSQKPHSYNPQLKERLLLKKGLCGGGEFKQQEGEKKPVQQTGWDPVRPASCPMWDIPHMASILTDSNAP